MPNHLEKFQTWCWPNVSCHTLYGWHNGWCSPHDTWCSQQSVRCGQHDVWCGRQDAYEVWWVGQNQCHTSPPYMAKNKFHLNVYLGIFMHFESIFFIFLNLENGLFQTHPPTKSGKFDFFFNPSFHICLCSCPVLYSFLMSVDLLGFLRSWV